MVQSYLRVQTSKGQTYYGILTPSWEVQVLSAPPWEQGTHSDLILGPDSYDIVAPCCPSKIIGVGRNFTQHAAEMGMKVPSEPLLFLKPPSALLGPAQAIVYPPQSHQVEYEGELALIIGRHCSRVTPDQAPEHIWGYTIANDVTARDLQKQDAQWTRAKGFDSFCPLGPWIVPEVNPNARLQTFVNDDAQPKQSATLDNMIFQPAFLVSYISQMMTLLPGDVVLTGTPAGVGPLQSGDRVRVEIEGIGCLENVVQDQMAVTMILGSNEQV